VVLSRELVVVLVEAVTVGAIILWVGLERMGLVVVVVVPVVARAQAARVVTELLLFVTHWRPNE
jgi:hypothetical protein